MSAIGNALRDLYGLAKNFGVIDTVSSRNNGLLDVLQEVRLAIGLPDVILVNDMETVGEWTESTSGEFDIAAEATTTKRGSAAQKFTATTASSGNVSSTYIAGGSQPSKDHNGLRQEDWRNSDFVGMWISTDAATTFGTDGELQLNIKNDGSWGTAVDVPAAAYASTAIWRYAEVDITSFTRDRVEAIRLENNNATAGDVVIVDEISRYKFGNGKGPAQGPSLILPIVSGQSPSRGQILQILETAGTARIQAEAAADTNTIGPCVIGGTGNAAGTVLGAVQVGGLAYLRTAASSGIADGDGVIWASGHTIADVDNAAAETNGFGQALEAPAEDTTGGHDILVLLRKNGPGHTT